jgi:hypothetical protein
MKPHAAASSERIEPAALAPMLVTDLRAALTQLICPLGKVSQRRIEPWKQKLFLFFQNANQR